MVKTPTLGAADIDAAFEIGTQFADRGFPIIAEQCRIRADAL